MSRRVVSSTHSEGFDTVQEAVAQVFPEAVVAPALVVGGTDSRYFTDMADDDYRFAPLRIGPDDTARFHGTDERVPVEGYADVVRFYAQLLVNATSP
ncbi:MAG: M20/M25/M40 family metallo-hydrolase [Myxococcota bacterium]